MHLVRTEPDALQGGRAQVGQEDICLGHQLMRQAQAALAREVEGDGTLAPVVQLEDRIGGEIAAENVEEGPARVAFGRLDLHHVGPQSAMMPPAPGPATQTPSSTTLTPSNGPLMERGWG